MIVFIFFLMIRRPPRSTRTDTLFPYTTLFRSRRLTSDLKGTGAMDGNMKMQRSSYGRFGAMIVTSTIVMFVLMYLNSYALDHVFYSQTRTWMAVYMGAAMAFVLRSEEVRVGKGGVSTCRSWWFTILLKNYKIINNECTP